MKQVVYRWVSVFLLPAYLITNHLTLPAYAAGNVPPASPSLRQNFDSDLKNVLVPAEMGTVDDFYQGPEKGLVILTQDAHSVPDAQRNIQRIIDYFQKNMA